MVQLDIRKMIESESPKKLLNERAITQALYGRVIRIAHRPITKYREHMKIPPSTRWRRALRHHL